MHQCHAEATGGHGGTAPPPHTHTPIGILLWSSRQEDGPTKKAHCCLRTLDPTAASLTLPAPPSTLIHSLSFIYHCQSSPFILCASLCHLPVFSLSLYPFLSSLLLFHIFSEKVQYRVIRSVRPCAKHAVPCAPVLPPLGGALVNTPLQLQGELRQP